MYFDTKNYFKNTHNHTAKHALKRTNKLFYFLILKQAAASRQLFISFYFSLETQPRMPPLFPNKKNAGVNAAVIFLISFISWIFKYFNVAIDTFFALLKAMNEITFLWLFKIMALGISEFGLTSVFLK